MPDAPLSILVLHPTFEEWGGAEWFIHGMLERFAERRGARVRVLTHRWESPWGDAPSYEVVEHGRGGYDTRPRDWDRIAREVAGAARERDVVWVHNHPATEWYARARRLPSDALPPALWYCHEPAARLWGERVGERARGGPSFGAALGRLAAHGRRAPARALRALRDRLTSDPQVDELRSSDQRAVRQMAAIQANSRYTAGRIEAIFESEAEVVYPIAEDLAALDPGARERDSIVLWIGRLAAPKRPELMLDAWQIAREECADLAGYRLVMVGDGPLRESIERRLGAGDVPAASLRAGVSRSELVSLLQRALVTVHLGLAEPLGLVPVEAMACGSALIAHAEGGALETVAEGETGWLSPIRSARDLAGLLVRVPSERTLIEAMGARGPLRVAELFSADATEAALWSLLSGVRSGGPTQAGPSASS